MINLSASTSSALPLRAPVGPTGKTGLNTVTPDADAAASASNAQAAPDGFAKAMKQAANHRPNKAVSATPQRLQNQTADRAQGPVDEAGARPPAQPGAAQDNTSPPGAVVSEAAPRSANDSSALQPPSIGNGPAIAEPARAASADPASHEPQRRPADAALARLATPASAVAALGHWKGAPEATQAAGKAPAGERDPRGRLDLPPQQPHLHSSSSAVAWGDSKWANATQRLQGRTAAQDPAQADGGAVTSNDAASRLSSTPESSLHPRLAKGPLLPQATPGQAREEADAGGHTMAHTTERPFGAPAAVEAQWPVGRASKAGAGADGAARTNPQRHTPDRAWDGAGLQAASGAAVTSLHADADPRVAEQPATAALAGGAPAPSWAVAAEAQMAQAATAPAARSAATVVDSASGPVAGGTSASIEAPVGSAAFAAEAGYRLALMVRDGVQTAELRLHPAEMGPVTVQIVVDGQNAQVLLSAQQADTRQALEASMPQLASNLRDSGLTLTGGGVFDQPSGQQGGAADGRGGAGLGGRSNGRNDGEDTIKLDSDRASPGANGLARRAARGIVDLLA